MAEDVKKERQIIIKFLVKKGQDEQCDYQQIETRLRFRHTEASNDKKVGKMFQDGKLSTDDDAWVDRPQTACSTTNMKHVEALITKDRMKDLAIRLNIVVVPKKSPMCQIMRFSLYCINGSIEGRRIA